jgi:hypothetical protein
MMPRYILHCGIGLADMDAIRVVLQLPSTVGVRPFHSWHPELLASCRNAKVPDDDSIYARRRLAVAVHGERSVNDAWLSWGSV